MSHPFGQIDPIKYRRVTLDARKGVTTFFLGGRKVTVSAFPMPMLPPKPAASGFGPPTGGTITTDGSDTIHTFTSSGTFYSGNLTSVELLLVAGGGASTASDGDGNPGGDSTSNNNGGGAGGGGSSNDGGNKAGGNTGAPGGAGTANSISGSSVTYSTGGPGGDETGGGGQPAAKSANTGDGGTGAAGGQASTVPGGNAGSGICIIRYLTANG